jgi:3-methylcrotonyl-CoA carboxylase beta subunit
MGLEQNKNIDEMQLKISNIKRLRDKIHLGGGQKNIDKLHAQGKLTARERIKLLLDPNTNSIEIGEFTGFEMYEEHGGCPAGGVVVVMGYVSNRLVIIVANDATVKAGAWFPITGKKNLRAQEIAMENHIPIIYLVDSAGVYLPMQDEIFPDKEHFGRIFRNNAKMSALGITQIAAVMGSCVAGGAYLPIMSDESLIVEGTGSIFLAGSYLVKAAIGEDIDNETLGGAATQSEISGIIDYKMKDDQECLLKIRSLIDKLGHKPKAGFDRVESFQPKAEKDTIYSFVSEDNSKPYDMVDMIKALVDNSEFDEYKALYGQSIVCGYGRVDGWAVGIVANQRKVVKSKKGEMQFGGVIYNDSADKAARFIMTCNQKKIPLVFLQDVTGFMVGSRSEQAGIIKDGAKLVNAMANSIVPKFTIIVGNSYGAGNYAMCGKAYDPRLICSWPSGKMAVMGGSQAANVILQIQVSALKSKGKDITEEEKQEILKNITDNYTKTTTPFYAAARLWTDGIIDPADTRTWISMGIEAANHCQIPDQYILGAIQT